MTMINQIPYTFRHIHIIPRMNPIIYGELIGSQNRLLERLV